MQNIFLGTRLRRLTPIGARGSGADKDDQFVGVGSASTDTRFIRNDVVLRTLIDSMDVLIASILWRAIALPIDASHSNGCTHLSMVAHSR